LHADDGEISRRRGLRVGYLPQEFETRCEQERPRKTSRRVRPIWVAWLRLYETGHRTEAEMTDLLHNIEQRTVGSAVTDRS